MMDENSTKKWMEITGNIRDDFIEEAAQLKKRRSTLLRIASAAAVLVLILGAFALLQRDANSEPIPLFAIRAYAADGSLKILDDVNESVLMASGRSRLFPKKQVYTFDISLGDYTGDPADFEEGKFIFREKGKNLQPGEVGEKIAVEWLRSEENGISGYRVTGWCDDYGGISITIEDKNGIVIHQKQLWVEREEDDYRITALISYTYREDMTTEELIDEVMRQNYSTSLGLASSFYNYYSFVQDDTGFEILEQRPDAAGKLLEHYIQLVEELEEVRGEVDGKVYWADWQYNIGLLTCMLSDDVYWNRLTREQQELYCAHGGWRAPEGMSPSFPGKYTFEFEMDQKCHNWDVITITYGDQTIIDLGWTDHVRLIDTYIVGWFEEPTNFTITVTDKEGNLLFEEKMRITPTGKTYDIAVLETTE